MQLPVNITYRGLKKSQGIEHRVLVGVPNLPPSRFINTGLQAGADTALSRRKPVLIRVRRSTTRARESRTYSFILLSPFGNDFLNHLFWVATTQQRIILIILSPIKNVAIISLRRFQVFSDFPELAFAQLQNVPSYPIALRSRVACK